MGTLEGKRKKDLINPLISSFLILISPFFNSFS